MFQQTILDNQEKLMNSSSIPRDYIFPDDILHPHINKILAFTGPRRVGKTTLMGQVLQNLVRKWHVQWEQIVRIDANEVNPSGFSMQKVLEDFFSLYPDLNPWIVIDEVQEIPDFPRHLFVAYNKGYQVMVSGSNAHLLSFELTTKLRWKVLEQQVRSLSRWEFLRFKDVGKLTKSTRWLGKQKSLCKEYLTYGWFPEVVLSSNKETKKNLLKNYFDVLLYKDLVERYKISKEYVLKYMIIQLGKSLTKEFSISKIFHDLSSQQIAITKPSLYSYLSYLQNIFFVSPLQQIQRQRWAKKWYLYDIGYLTLWENASWGKRLESVVVVEYMHRFTSSKVLSWLFFGRNRWWEIDVVSPDELIQICRSLHADNIKRETDPLLISTSKKRKILIYFDIDKTIHLPKGIEYISLFDWLVR